VREQLEGRNPVVEALRRQRRRVVRVLIDVGARPDPRIAEIERLAAEVGAKVERVERRQLDKLADGRVHQGVIADAEAMPQLTMRQVMDEVYEAGRDPFFVLADEVVYEHNLGAILRTVPGVRGRRRWSCPRGAARASRRSCSGWRWARRRSCRW
jgi:23S rRNA (guanosine2251-2'-O)-methyltransferase